ncbi:MAG: hypothetical protein A3A61_00485 [Candidatus Woykebacteria bacterium RIFCSPLOWO2_01_FULL_43_14]|uniref:Uncharacterized protein n=1 Tax=Candidatus Woykebacteria bacterium RIFCSPLOWO2_01_FULL_43_14 TaxID=1802605 RepID=A0A1G1WTS8_9BACT|nr:MAG: hypothetical protein A3A61_00485 [Candidatus Woykebacteria bacterium RIFCSPLOWO2_01_FULL_43_14]
MNNLVTVRHSGLRIDLVAADVFGISRSASQRLIRDSKILLNGERTFPAQKVWIGDKILLVNNQPEPIPTSDGAKIPENKLTWDLTPEGTNGIRPMNHDHIVLIGHATCELMDGRQRVEDAHVLWGDGVQLVQEIKTAGKAVVPNVYIWWEGRLLHFPTVQMRWEVLCQLQETSVIRLRVFKSSYQGKPRYNFRIRPPVAGKAADGRFTLTLGTPEEDLCEPIHSFETPRGKLLGWGKLGS